MFCRIPPRAPQITLSQINRFKHQPYARVNFSVHVQWKVQVNM